MRPRKPTYKVLPPLHPNAGLSVLYRDKLLGMIDCMHRSVTRFVLAAYKREEPHVAKLAKDAWRESDHPRRDDGKFGEGGGGGSGSGRKVPLDPNEKKAAEKLGLGEGYSGTQSGLPAYTVDNPLPLSKNASLNDVMSAKLPDVTSEMMKSVDIDDLRAVQDYVMPSQVASYLNHNQTRPMIAHVGGELIIVDGTHRTLAAKLKGNKIDVYDIGELKRDPNAKDSALAQDATPADELKKVVQRLRKRWTRNFNKGAIDLGEYFIKSAGKRTDYQLRKILKDAGFSIDFKMTQAQRDVLNASINENVALIKSIPEQYLKSVEGKVMRSVQVGRDVGQLAKELQKSYGVTKRRARLIAKDQNFKASAALNRSRQLQIGIEQAVWMHSHAGKEPRPSHVKQDGKKFDVAKGWFDPDEKQWVWPGTLINCRCASRSVIKIFE